METYLSYRIVVWFFAAVALFSSQKHLKMQRTKPTQPLAVTAPNQTATLSETKFEIELCEYLAMAECLNKHAAEMKRKAESVMAESLEVQKSLLNLHSCYVKNPDIRKALAEFKWQGNTGLYNIRKMILDTFHDLSEKVIYDPQLSVFS